MVDRLVLDGSTVYLGLMTYGTAHDAARAIAGDLTYLGEGCMRRTYVNDGIVYKVEMAPGANYSEYENAAAIRATVPDPFVIPEMSLHYVGNTCVLAMPFIDGDLTGECIGDYLGLGCDCPTPCMTPDIAHVANSINGDALSWGNTIVKDGVYYIIDLDSTEFAS